MKFPKLNQKNVLIGVAVVLLLSVLGVFTYYPDYEMARVGLQYTASGWTSGSPPFIFVGYGMDRETAYITRVTAINYANANPTTMMTCYAMPTQNNWISKRFNAFTSGSEFGSFGVNHCVPDEVIVLPPNPTTPPLPSMTPPPCLLTPSSCAIGMHLYLEGCMCVADSVPSATPTVAPTATPFVPPFASPTPYVPPYASLTPTPYVPPYASPAPTPPAGVGGQADYLFYLIPVGVVLIVAWTLKKKRRK